MKIDSHQHFWKYDPSIDLWITDDMKIIKNDFLPEHLRPLLNHSGIDGCVAVQSRQTEEDTKFLLDLAAQNDFIKGIVGWTDLRSSNVDERLSYYSQFKKLKSFRHIVQGEPAGFMMQNAFINGVNKLHEYNFTYDLLIKQYQLDEAIKFVDKITDTRIVIDHIAKPLIEEKEISQWKSHITSIAKFPNVYCKISGMVTEGNWKNWKAEDFIPYLDVVTKSFDVDRIMYGSDWPVCLVAASYQQQLDIITKYFSGFSDADKDKIFGLNAIKFYNLN